MTDEAYDNLDIECQSEGKLQVFCVASGRIERGEDVETYEGG